MMMSSLARQFLVNCMGPEKKNDIAEEKKFNREVAAINPNMGIATLASNTRNCMVQTKFGSSPVGSTVINCLIQSQNSPCMST